MAKDSKGKLVVHWLGWGQQSASLISDHCVIRALILKAEESHIIKLEERPGTKEIIHGDTMGRKSILKRNRTEFLEPLNKR